MHIVGGNAEFFILTECKAQFDSCEQMIDYFGIIEK
jgi:hypothetical protein